MEKYLWQGRRLFLSRLFIRNYGDEKMDNQNTTTTLLIIASAGLAIAGIIFLLVAIFDEDKDNWMLISALVCVILSNLFNVIRTQFNNTKNQ